MTQEEKELLLKDLSARLPYGVKYKTYLGDVFILKDITLSRTTTKYYIDDNAFGLDQIKPYLRPMSSMTDEERKEFSKFLVKRYCEEDWEGHISTSYCIEIDNVYTDDEDGIKYPSAFQMDAIDWLNAHHFDYRGLIPMSLALEAKEGMYK